MSRREPFRCVLLDRALEHGWAPDAVLRLGSLYGAWARERSSAAGGVASQGERLRALVVIWGYRGGDRWLVSHYLLEPRRSG